MKRTVLLAALAAALLLSSCGTAAAAQSSAAQPASSQSAAASQSSAESAAPAALTAEQIKKANDALGPTLATSSDPSALNPAGIFLMQYYDSPKDLKLPELLAYFPSEQTVTDADEFKALKAEASWPFGADSTLSSMPVPIHKIPAADVDAALKKYMNISLSDLTIPANSADLIYLKQYDAFYNFTSDANFGQFTCTGGEVEGDTVRLFSNDSTLCFHKSGDNYYFYSYQAAK